MREVAVIDPGPDAPAHVGALTSAVGGAGRVTILLTHGHVDHAPAASALANATGAEVHGPEGVEGVARVLSDGDPVDTDEGELVALSTPGHAEHHLCFHWPARRALFAGDLLLGEGDTTWVGAYPGCVADYLASLERLRGLDLDVIYPAHGPAITDPAAALERYRVHRAARIEQVRAALDARPEAEAEDLVDAIYGNALPERVRRAATMSLAALVEHVRTTGSA